MLWALRCEGLTADERDTLAAAWWAPATPRPAPGTGPADQHDGAAGDDAADDEWAREWAHRMGLT